jgi:hypothetical protein
MQCREQAMEEDLALKVFGTDKYSIAVKQGDYCFQSNITLHHLQVVHKPETDRAKSNSAANELLFIR